MGSRKGTLIVSKSESFWSEWRDSNPRQAAHSVSLPIGGWPHSLAAVRQPLGDAMDAVVSLCDKSNSAPQKGAEFDWSEWRDSNPRHPAPKAGALPAALHPVIWFFGGRPLKGPQHIYYITPFRPAQGFSLMEVYVMIKYILIQ